MERVTAPYKYPNVPDYIKNLPEGAQKLFVRVFNKIYKKSKDDKAARQAGWGAVKNRYVKKGGKWVLKKKSTKAASETLEMEVASFNSYQDEDGNKHYTVELRTDEGSVYLRYDTKPPKFLSEIGNVINIALSDKKQTSKIEDLKASSYPGNFTSHREVAAVDNKAEKSQETRSKKYGIVILKGGYAIKSSTYASVSDGKFADPVNYSYPMDTAPRAKAALNYFGMHRNYNKYSEKDRARVWGRMKSLASKFITDLDETPPWKRKEG